MQVPIPEKLLAIVAGEGEVADLAEAALLVATTAYPDLDVSHHLGKVRDMAGVLSGRLAPEATVQQKLTAINDLLYGELKYTPDAANYYDPRNSFLNDVLERARGIPITMSVLYIQLGRALGLELDGVSFPGHFLVRCEVDGGLVVIDAYNHGTSLSLDDLRDRLQQSQGAEVRAESVLSLLAPAHPHDIVVRMLRNLKGIYLDQRRHAEALTVIEWLVHLEPKSAPELRDRGLVFEELECFRAALTDYETYLRQVPDAEDGETIRSRVLDMRRAASRLN